MIITTLPKESPVMIFTICVSDDNENYLNDFLLPLRVVVFSFNQVFFEASNQGKTLISIWPVIQLHKTGRQNKIFRLCHAEPIISSFDGDDYDFPDFTEHSFKKGLPGTIFIIEHNLEMHKLNKKTGMKI